MHDQQTLLERAVPAALDPAEIETLLAPLPSARRTPSGATHRLRIELARGRFSPECVVGWGAGSLVPFEPRSESIVVQASRLPEHRLTPLAGETPAPQPRPESAARPGSAVDIYLNDRLAALGELFVEEGRWRVRIVELVTASVRESR